MKNVSKGHFQSLYESQWKGSVLVTRPTIIFISQYINQDCAFLMTLSSPVVFVCPNAGPLCTKTQETCR